MKPFFKMEPGDWPIYVAKFRKMIWALTIFMLVAACQSWFFWHWHKPSKAAQGCIHVQLPQDAIEGMRLLLDEIEPCVPGFEPDLTKPGLSHPATSGMGIACSVR